MRMSNEHDFDRDINEPTDWAVALGGTVVAIAIVWFALL
jgi:hypothetical protein